VADTPHLFRSVALGDWLDERTVLGRIFPFGEWAKVADPTPEGLDIYEESFLPGCTARMRAASPKRIKFTLDHSDAFDRETGFCMDLAEKDDGAWGTFRLYEGHDLPKYQSMLRESHDGLSVEFIDVTHTPPTGPRRERRQVHIFAVTATPIPAYNGARIMAMREGDPLELATPNLDRVKAMLADWPS
jgi:HK97 family phage prohead protease